MQLTTVVLKVDGLNRQVTSLLKEGRYEHVLGLATQVRDFAQQNLPRDHPSYADSLSNLASAYQVIGNHLAAEPLYREVVAIRRVGKDDCGLEYALALNNLGALYRVTGDYPAAERLYREARDIFRAALGEEHEGYALSLHNLGILHHAKGDFNKAVPLLRQALAIRRAAHGADHPDVALSISSLASAYADMGDDAAIGLYQQAVEMRRRQLGEYHPAVATSLTNLAVAYHYVASRSLSKTDLEAVKQLYEQALSIRRTVLGELHPHVAISLTNLAAVNRQLRNYSAAAELNRKALSICIAALGEKHPEVALMQRQLAHLYSDVGDFQAAEPLYQRALEIRRAVFGDNHPDVASSFHDIGILCAAVGRVAESLEYALGAAKIEDRLIGQIFSIGSEKQRLAYLEGLQAPFYGFLSLVLRHFADSSPAICTALELVLRRKALTAEATAAQRDGVLRGRHQKLETKLRALSSLRMQIAHITLSGPGTSGLEAHGRLLAELTARKESLEVELSAEIPEMSLEHQLRAADRRAVALCLPEDVVLVEFVRFKVYDFAAVPAQGESHWNPARYLAFVLTAKEPDEVVMVDLGEAGSIDRLIADFRASITGESEHGASRDMVRAKALPVPTDEDHAGRELRATVFDRLERTFHGRRRLLLAPDGDLTRLPFEALPTNDGRRLIDDYRISYLGCGRDVLRFQAQPTGRHAEAVVAADPDFDLHDDGKTASRQPDATASRQSRDLGEGEVRFDRLPGTREEGERIARLLKVRPWLRAEVLEKRLKQVRSPWILHLATHGFFLADQDRDPQEAAWTTGGDAGRFSGLRLENPLLRSGLALAGGNTWLQRGAPPPEAEDGLLTAEDVTGLDLLDTELVVLSACDTGLGEIRTGEGVFGLRRAFVLAGAKTLVMSLWKVPDEETGELMEDFYRRILAGEPRAEALRNAQLALKARRPDPYYWGAFICQGNPGALPPRRRWYYRLDGKKSFGPVSDAELKDLVRTGRLVRSGKVSLDRKTWREASHLKGVRWPS